MNITYKVSYFYQIRFFRPYMIPFSTAIWDPKWYHAFKGQTHNFVDKNGVLNGLRFVDFAPRMSIDGECNGRDNCTINNPSKCAFLSNYRKQIEAVDPDEIRNYFETWTTQIKARLGFSEDPMVVFIVHEAPDNKCSEREVLLTSLPKMGIPIEELSYPIKEYY